MTITHDRPVHLHGAAPVPPDRRFVATVLRDELTRLGDRIAADGIDAHHPEVGALARAVRPRSPLLASVLCGTDIAPVRERAFDRAVRLVLLRPADHAALAVALTS